jgi:hypothetical protein
MGEHIVLGVCAMKRCRLWGLLNVLVGVWEVGVLRRRVERPESGWV